LPVAGEQLFGVSRVEGCDLGLELALSTQQGGVHQRHERGGEFGVVE